MKKGIDRTFLHYGVRGEDMALIEQTCQDSDIAHGDRPRDSQMMMVWW